MNALGIVDAVLAAFGRIFSVLLGSLEPSLGKFIEGAEFTELESRIIGGFLLLFVPLIVIAAKVPQVVLRGAALGSFIALFAMLITAYAGPGEDSEFQEPNSILIGFFVMFLIAASISFWGGWNGFAAWIKNFAGAALITFGLYSAGLIELIRPLT